MSVVSALLPFVGDTEGRPRVLPAPSHVFWPFPDPDRRREGKDRSGRFPEGSRDPCFPLTATANTSVSGGDTPRGSPWASLFGLRVRGASPLLFVADRRRPAHPGPRTVPTPKLSLGTHQATPSKSNRQTKTETLRRLSLSRRELYKGRTESFTGVSVLFHLLLRSSVLVPGRTLHELRVRVTEEGSRVGVSDVPVETTVYQGQLNEVRRLESRVVEGTPLP